jgi:hypothetical protein
MFLRSRAWSFYIEAYPALQLEQFEFPTSERHSLGIIGLPVNQAILLTLNVRPFQGQ